MRPCFLYLIKSKTRIPVFLTIKNKVVSNGQPYFFRKHTLRLLARAVAIHEVLIPLTYSMLFLFQYQADYLELRHKIVNEAHQTVSPRCYARCVNTGAVRLFTYAHFPMSATASTASPNGIYGADEYTVRSPRVHPRSIFAGADTFRARRRMRE